MIKAAYLYCSYSHSPIGFRIGKLDIADKKDFLDPIDEMPNPQVVKCFEDDSIIRAYGRLSSDYVYILKEIKHSNDSVEKYGNFAC